MSVICNEEKKVFDILFATANRLPSLIWQGRRSVKLGEAHLWVTVLDVDIPRRLQGRHEAQKMLPWLAACFRFCKHMCSSSTVKLSSGAHMRTGRIQEGNFRSSCG